LTLVKSKQIDAEEEKKKKQQIYELIAEDSVTDVVIKTYEKDKSKIPCILYLDLLIFFRTQSRKNIKKSGRNFCR
jgi:hypothetical protein